MSNKTEAQTVHDLRVLPIFFDKLLSGEKPFEIRFNDRHFKVGDVLHLRESDHNREYTGREMKRLVSYVTDWEQRAGYVVLGLARQ